jgi:prepilin-type N-terminal cleavage/methylation domain-containing protein
MRRNRTGLPLIELLIVVFIIGILVSIAIPKRSNAAAPAHESVPSRSASPLPASVRLAGLGTTRMPHAGNA